MLGLNFLGDGGWLVRDDDVLELVLGDGADCECVWRKGSALNTNHYIVIEYLQMPMAKAKIPPPTSIFLTRYGLLARIKAGDCL